MARIAPGSHVYIDLKALLASQHPSADLRINEFEELRDKFLKGIIDYSNRAIEEITRRRNSHVQELKRIDDNKKNVESETTACKVKEIKLMEVLDRERNEKRDAEASVSELKRNFASIKEKCASLDNEIDQCNLEVVNLRREKDKDTAILNRNASLLRTEVEACQSRLGISIDGVDPDKLLVRFSTLNPNSHRDECSFILDVGGPSYKVPISNPPIRNLSTLVDQLNKEKDIYWFIKEMRSKFVESMALECS